MYKLGGPTKRIRRSVCKNSSKCPCDGWFNDKLSGIYFGVFHNVGRLVPVVEMQGLCAHEVELSRTVSQLPLTLQALLFLTPDEDSWKNKTKVEDEEEPDDEVDEKDAYNVLILRLLVETTNDGTGDCGWRFFRGA